ncbi:TPA: phage tail protein [Enterobacter hormaechei]|nr:phage tail protein [Enterobacter hormaechei]HBL6102390.1 phage tail protein [Enterobacter hormaechei]HBL9170158.1 phage tail protein [Enterobacter hormaechei]
MSVYIWSAKNSSFIPVTLRQSYINAGWDLSDAIPIDDAVSAEFMGTPPDGKRRDVGGDGLPCWVDVNLIEIQEEQAS